MATYGNKIETKAYPCRFAYISTPNQEAKFSVELVVPKAEAKELNELLYSENQKLIEANKATAKATKPKPLYSPIYLYDEEAKEPVLDDDGERVVDEDVVKFTFKSSKKPKIQFKKGLDSSAIIGSGSVIKLSCCAYSSTFKDKTGKEQAFTALTFDGVRVDELVTYSASSTAFSGSDDDYEDEDGDYEDAPKEPEESEEEAPKKPKKGKSATPKDF